MTYRIIVADDHPVFREGLNRLITKAIDDAEVLETDRFAGVLKLAAEAPPDLFVLDLNFPGFLAADSIAQLRIAYPMAAITIVSMQDDPQTIEDVISLNVDGFISKAIDPIRIGSAIASVLDGEVVIIGPQDAERLPESGVQSNIAKISARQLDVLKLVVAGKTNKEIARALELSPFTVRSHVSALLKKLGLSTRSAAAATGRDAGL